MYKLKEKVLITGGAGFIGSHLTRTLLLDGYDVTVMDNLFTGTKANILPFKDDPNFHFVLHDVTQPFRGQYDVIYNLACPASPIHYQKNPVETLTTSFLGMMNVLDLAQRTKARVLHTSTSEVYGDPDVHPQPESYHGNVSTIGIRSCYDEGKRAAETLAADYHHEYGVDVRIVRIFNTYGPNMHPCDGRVISNFVMQALNNQPITLYGNGSQTRSFQYVDDLIRAFRLYMDHPTDTLKHFFDAHGMRVPVLNIGNPDEFTIRALAEEVLALLPHSKSQLVYKPLPSDDPRRRKPDNTLSAELLGWYPEVPLREGLKQTIQYFQTIH